jgi:hypothetical protein
MWNNWIVKDVPVCFLAPREKCRDDSLFANIARNMLEGIASVLEMFPRLGLYLQPEDGGSTGLQDMFPTIGEHS